MTLAVESNSLAYIPEPIPPPPMDCMYCHKLTTSNKDYFRYCENCNHFKVSYAFPENDSHIAFISIEPLIKNDYYAIMWLDKKQIVFYHKHVTITVLPIFNLTPQNYNNKLKTILTFL